MGSGCTEPEYAVAPALSMQRQMRTASAISPAVRPPMTVGSMSDRKLRCIRLSPLSPSLWDARCGFCLRVETLSSATLDAWVEGGGRVREVWSSDPRAPGSKRALQTKAGNVSCPTRRRALHRREGDLALYERLVWAETVDATVAPRARRPAIRGSVRSCGPWLPSFRQDATEEVACGT